MLPYYKRRQVCDGREPRQTCICIEAEIMLFGIFIKIQLDLMTQLIRREEIISCLSHGNRNQNHLLCSGIRHCCKSKFLVMQN